MLCIDHVLYIDAQKNITTTNNPYFSAIKKIWWKKEYRKERDKRRSFNKYIHCVSSKCRQLQFYWILCSLHILSMYTILCHIWFIFADISRSLSCHHRHQSQRIRCFTRFQWNRLSNGKHCIQCTWWFLSLFSSFIFCIS